MPAFGRFLPIAKAKAGQSLRGGRRSASCSMLDVFDPRPPITYPAHPEAFTFIVVSSSAFSIDGIYVPAICAITRVAGYAFLRR